MVLLQALTTLNRPEVATAELLPQLFPKYDDDGNDKHESFQGEDADIPKGKHMPKAAALEVGEKADVEKFGRQRIKKPDALRPAAVKNEDILDEMEHADQDEPHPVLSGFEKQGQERCGDHDEEEIMGIVLVDMPPACPKEKIQQKINVRQICDKQE